MQSAMPDAHATIRELVTTRKVVLFMKGSRAAPQCGFSGQVVGILDGLLPAYDTVDVLADPAMRDAIKQFSDWPTIPQLYVDGRFVGGCDIVRELSTSGELAALLGVDAGASATAPPVLELTGRAATAIMAAREAPGDELRLVISPAFEKELFFDGPAPGDVVVEARGVTIRLDRSTASRAAGTRIDWVETGAGGGFKVDCPAEPPRAASVRGLTAKGLRMALDAGGPLMIFDVRTDAERALASIDGAVALDDDGQRRLEATDRSARVVFMCHHGVRSRVAAEAALRKGFTDVWNLEGGIDAWSTEVDSAVARY